MTEEYKIEMNENNRKLQTSLDYFNERVERAPCTYLLCNGDGALEGYSLALNLGEGRDYRGPRGVTVDLDINFNDVVSQAETVGYSTRQAFPLSSPGFLQETLKTKRKKLLINSRSNLPIKLMT